MDEDRLQRQGERQQQSDYGQQPSGAALGQPGFVQVGAEGILEFAGVRAGQRHFDRDVESGGGLEEPQLMAGDIELIPEREAA